MHSMYSSATCSLTCILEKVSKKWSLLILRALTQEKKLRFCKLEESLPDINARILCERLSELEREGLIARTVETSKPVCVTYAITRKGMDLRAVFEGFALWAKKWGHQPFQRKPVRR
ncbi:MAG: helix-turn-helix domain-containing protein [Candidatus Peregrinibacteria bacterium]|nr:helix-turn-helix domain-containing protein [Candidatus Peregrinibacteria bacterium]